MGGGADILLTYGQGNAFREAIGLDQDGQLASGRVWTWVQVCRSQIQDSFHPSTLPHTHRSLGCEAAWRLPTSQGPKVAADWCPVVCRPTVAQCQEGFTWRAQMASRRDPGRHGSSPSFSTLSLGSVAAQPCCPSRITSLTSCCHHPVMVSVQDDSGKVEY